MVKIMTVPLPPVGAAAEHTGCGIISPSLIMRVSLFPYLESFMPALLETVTEFLRAHYFRVVTNFLSIRSLVGHIKEILDVLDEDTEITARIYILKEKWRETLTPLRK